MINLPSFLQSRAKNNISQTIVDYRNGKYQGTIDSHTRLPQGMGMFLTEDYHLALGFWKQGRIQGYCFIVYPNGSISFGTFSKGQPKDMCCFQFPNGKILYAFTNGDQDSLCLVDSYNRLITFVRMHRDSRKQFFDNMHEKKMNYSTGEFKQGRGVFFRKKIQILEETSYKNQLQKWTKIQEYSKSVIKSEFKEYKSFVKFNFCNLPDSQFELTQTKQEVQLRFKKSSLICHIIQHNHNENTLRCKLLGYYDENKRKVEILRKMGQGIDNKVEEVCDEQAFSYTNKRPIQAKQKLIDYFKKSTHFINTYVKSRELQVIGTYFQSLFEMINSQISTKKAQTLLQLGRPTYPSSPQQRERYKKESKYQNNIDLQSLAEVTNETFEKINRKNGQYFHKGQYIDKKNRYNIDFEQNNHYIPKKSNNKYSETKENYLSPEKPRASKYGESSPTLRQKKYLLFAEESSPYKRSRYLDNKTKGYESPSKSMNKRYTYITNHNHSINADEYNQRHSKKKLTIDLYHSKSEYLHNDQHNYNEGEGDYRYQGLNHNRQSIKKLTKDYELISQKLTVERQISNRKDYEASNPSPHKYNGQNSRSPKKFTYLKSPMYSPSSQSNKGKRQWR